MVLCNTWPRQTFLPLLLGSVLEAVGVGLMAWALYFENKSVIFGMMALAGAGTGLRMLPGKLLPLLPQNRGKTETDCRPSNTLFLSLAGSLHAIGFFPDHIATVVSLMAVAMPFGGTLALTIMSTVFNNTSGATNGHETVGFNDPVAAKVCTLFP